MAFKNGKMKKYESGRDLDSLVDFVEGKLKSEVEWVGIPVKPSVLGKFVETLKADFEAIYNLHKNAMILMICMSLVAGVWMERWILRPLLARAKAKTKAE